MNLQISLIKLSKIKKFDRILSRNTDYALQNKSVRWETNEISINRVLC